MKMGIKEFRERLGVVARGSEPVQLTDRGAVIGTYTPWPKMDGERRQRARAAVEDHVRWRDGLREQGVDTEEWLAALGIDPWGNPVAKPHDR